MMRTSKILTVASLIFVLGFGSGFWINSHEPSDDNGGLLPSASAASTSLSWNLALTSISLAKYTSGGTSPYPPDVIQGRGQETYGVGAEPPTGTPDEYWNIYYYPANSNVLIHARAHNDGSTTYEYHDVWTNGYGSFWDDRRISDFLIDSSQAVAVAHATGGALAIQGQTEVEIDYQLMEFDNSPTWDIVYRDPVSRESLFDARVDAMTAIPIANQPSFPPFDLSVAVSKASPASTVHPDAKLVHAVAIEGSRDGLRPNVRWDGGAIPLATATIEQVEGDGLTASWLLEFYSPTLGGTRMVMVVGDEGPVAVGPYPTMVGSAARSADLGSASARPVNLELDDAWSAIPVAVASGSIPAMADMRIGGMVAHLELGPLDATDLSQGTTWYWRMVSGGSHAIEIGHQVDAHSGAVRY